MPDFNKEFFLSKWESQVRKGLLDFIILMYLHKKKYYGYELISEIKKISAMQISEGTIYPLLNRIKKEGLITSSWVEMEKGIPRKYYEILPKGIQTLAEMKESWAQINDSLQNLME